jgi:acyl-CoA synthetase (AMP-forming)/AMP-acid ligase II
MNAARLLHACALSQPGDLAIQRGTACADYLAVSMDAERIATILTESFDVNPDQRVAMILPSVPELASVLFGVLWAGAVAAVLDPEPDVAGVTRALHWAKSRLLVAWHADAELAEVSAAAEQTQCLFVEPREFSRMVGHTSPRVALTERRPSDLAVIGRAADGETWSFTHTELTDAGRNLARSQRLEPRAAVTLPADANGRDLVLHLTAAVSAGASLVVVDADDALAVSHPAATHGVCK